MRGATRRYKKRIHTHIYTYIYTQESIIQHRAVTYLCQRNPRKSTIVVIFVHLFEEQAELNIYTTYINSFMIKII